MSASSRARRLALIALLAGLLPLSVAARCDAPPNQPAPTSACHEDESCWNCRTMGNRKCGPDETIL